MKTKLNIPMLITAVLVKTYMSVARIWAAGEKVRVEVKSWKPATRIPTIPSPKTA